MTQEERIKENNGAEGSGSNCPYHVHTGGE
jgi:hypothetical protein